MVTTLLNLMLFLRIVSIKKYVSFVEGMICLIQGHFSHLVKSLEVEYKLFFVSLLLPKKFRFWFLRQFNKNRSLFFCGKSTKIGILDFSCLQIHAHFFKFFKFSISSNRLQPSKGLTLLNNHCWYVENFVIHNLEVQAWGQLLIEPYLFLEEHT